MSAAYSVMRSDGYEGYDLLSNYISKINHLDTCEMDEWYPKLTTSLSAERYNRMFDCNKVELKKFDTSSLQSTSRA